MRRTILILRGIGQKLSIGGRFMLPKILLRRFFRHASGTYRIDDFDGDMSIDLRLSEHMERRIFWMGYYNTDIVAILDKLMRDGMVVVDVGANIGEISMVAAKRVGKSGKVFAFEPIDELADELQSNIDRNGLSQVVIVRSGLADSIIDKVPIYASCGQGDQADEHRGLGSLYGEKAEGTPLQYIGITTLDAYFAEHPVDRVDFIKIDIEGAELPCLRGAENTIRQHRPLLIIEVQEASAAAAGYRASDILDFLTTVGYTFSCIGRNGRLTPLDTNSLHMYQNVLCQPS